MGDLKKSRLRITLMDLNDPFGGQSINSSAFMGNSSMCPKFPTNIADPVDRRKLLKSPSDDRQFTTTVRFKVDSGNEFKANV